MIVKRRKIVIVSAPDHDRVRRNEKEIGNDLGAETGKINGNIVPGTIKMIFNQFFLKKSKPIPTKGSKRCNFNSFEVAHA